LTDGAQSRSVLRGDVRSQYRCGAAPDSHRIPFEPAHRDWPTSNTPLHLARAPRQQARVRSPTLDHVARVWRDSATVARRPLPRCEVRLADGFAAARNLRALE